VPSFCGDAPEPRLITLSISPFNELARWSLERAGILYREEGECALRLYRDER
jgi:hypothetical protein